MGSRTVAVVAGVVAAAVAGGIFVCSVFVASCGNMAADRDQVQVNWRACLHCPSPAWGWDSHSPRQRTAPGAVAHGVGSEGVLRATRLGQWRSWSR